MAAAADRTNTCREGATLDTMANGPVQRRLRASVVRLGVALALTSALLPWAPGAAPAKAAAALRLHSVGLFDPGSAFWYLRDTTGYTTRISFGRIGDVPLVGDWDGDGVDTPGVYRPQEGRLLIRNGREAISFVYPMPVGGLPVVADTDGDGRDTVSIGKGGRLYVMDGLGSGPAELDGPDPLPITLPDDTDGLVGGDFDGDGVDEVAALHDGLVEVVGPGRATTLRYLGPVLAVAGDWDGDGIDTVGGYDSWSAQFRLYERDGEATPAPLFYGSTGMLPVAGVFGDLPGNDLPPPYRPGLPALAAGDAGSEVMLLQQELARRHLFRGPIDGEFGPATAYAVVAFHKVLGVERTWEWEEEDSARMARFALPPLPDRPDEPDRVEVDIGRQVLFLFEDGEVTAIVPVSTAGSYVYYSIRQGAWVGAGTPRGDFTLTRHSMGWNCDPVTGWCIYNPWNFTEYYALHGYRSVPEYPASHGCVRIPTWEADILDDRFYIGMPFHVWDAYSPTGS
jgi:N-acetylmuramoyl-L-alanine amidase